MAALTVDQALKLTRDLAKELDDDRTALTRLDRYYSGNQPLTFATEKFREAFGGLFKASAVNWCPLVVSAVLERLRVTGFRAGTAAGVIDRAWQIWQANNLDADSNLTHREALKYGRSYVVVGAGEQPGDPPLITVESPLDVIHRNSSANRRRRRAALRVFTDDDGTMCATLYTPELTFRWQRAAGASTESPISSARWEPRRIADRSWPEPQPLGVVPVVPFLASPELDGWGRSELADVMPVQDMVNKTVADMLVASEYVALPQRWATGMDIDRDPVTGQPRPPFDKNSRIWQAEDENTKFGQFQAADLTGYVKTLESLKQDIATMSRTPPHYFYLSGQFPSGESIKSAEAGLVAKSRERMLTFGEAWEEIIRLALRIDGTDIAARPDLETIWGDPEYRTEGEHVDATLKKQALGVPTYQLWEDLNYSPQQIARMKALRLQEQLEIAAITGGATVAAGEAPVGQPGMAGMMTGTGAGGTGARGLGMGPTDARLPVGPGVPGAAQGSVAANLDKKYAPPGL